MKTASVHTTICSTDMSQKTLSPLEQEIMNVVWECKNCSVRDVVKKMNPSRNLAYTTVATLLQRLFEKELVIRSNQGTVLYYSPKISKTVYGKHMAKSFIRTFFMSFGDTAIVSFAESIEKLPKDKKEYLLQLLDKKNSNESK